MVVEFDSSPLFAMESFRLLRWSIIPAHYLRWSIFLSRFENIILNNSGKPKDSTGPTDKRLSLELGF